MITHLGLDIGCKISVLILIYPCWHLLRSWFSLVHGYSSKQETAECSLFPIIRLLPSSLFHVFCWLTSSGTPGQAGPPCTLYRPPVQHWAHGSVIRNKEWLPVWILKSDALGLGFQMPHWLTVWLGAGYHTCLSQFPIHKLESSRTSLQGCESQRRSCM